MYLGSRPLRTSRSAMTSISGLTLIYPALMQRCRAPFHVTLSKLSAFGIFVAGHILGALGWWMTTWPLPTLRSGGIPPKWTISNDLYKRPNPNLPCPNATVLGSFPYSLFEAIGLRPLRCRTHSWVAGWPCDPSLRFAPGGSPRSGRSAMI